MSSIDAKEISAGSLTNYRKRSVVLIEEDFEQLVKQWNGIKTYKLFIPVDRSVELNEEELKDRKNVFSSLYKQSSTTSPPLPPPPPSSPTLESGLYSITSIYDDRLPHKKRCNWLDQSNIIS